MISYSELLDQAQPEAVPQLEVVGLMGSAALSRDKKDAVRPMKALRNHRWGIFSTSVTQDAAPLPLHGKLSRFSSTHYLTDLHHD